MADHLSTATRNLLTASVLAISANAFNVSVDKIPVGGLSITFGDRLFAFLLLIVLVYFLCTFILYYAIDMKNYEATPHQTSTEEAYKERIDEFPSKYFYKVTNELRALAPEGYQVNINTSHIKEFTGGAPKPFMYSVSLIPPAKPPPGPSRDAVILERKDIRRHPTGDGISSRYFKQVMFRKTTATK